MSYHPILERLYCFHRERYRQCYLSTVAVLMSQVTFCNDSNVMHIFTVYSWMEAKNLQRPSRLMKGLSLTFNRFELSQETLLRSLNTETDIESTNHKRFHSQTFDKYSSMLSTFHQHPKWV